MLGLLGGLATAIGLAYILRNLYQQDEQRHHAREEESTTPRPSPSSYPPPVQNIYYRLPTEVSKVSSTPSLSSSRTSPSNQKNPSTVENYHRTPTGVSKKAPSLSSPKPSPSTHASQKNPRIAIHEFLEEFAEENTPEVYSPPSPSPKAFQIPISSSSKKGELPRYDIPEHLKEEINKDIVPSVLKGSLCPANYANYFAALLYAEDFYCEKWSEYVLADVTLKLLSKEAFFKAPNLNGTKKNNKSRTGNCFVEFEIDSVPERRPYLLSRDYVRLQPSERKAESFQGVLFRVVRSKTVLTEFEDDFHKQHSPSKKYNVSFSFNRVCLKRSHQAISAAMDPLLCSILFPDPSSRIDSLNSSTDIFSSDRGTGYGQFQVTSRILNLKDPVPYLIEGPLSETPSGCLSSTGTVIKEAILQIYRTPAHCRILVCAPRNRTCDALTRSLLEDIPNSKLFRANAAFRDYDLVPDDIIPQCSFEKECFTCPSLPEIQKFMIVTSTFISTFRLYAAGIAADHFTHIFLVDASSTTEPEAVVALANLISKKTVIVVAGSSKDIPYWVRSDIARRNGLKRSFFQRLLERRPYSTNDPRFISHVTW
ncbi:probable RNA helicase SDE3 [Typha angustifolia]|uniref:probable RNA helicase SDE3 n=1 Tax=Typha angustifolia TaxID=59011 RepID=UPI003C2D18ED